MAAWAATLLFWSRLLVVASRSLAAVELLSKPQAGTGAVRPEVSKRERSVERSPARSFCLLQQTRLDGGAATVREEPPTCSRPAPPPPYIRPSLGPYIICCRRPYFRVYRSAPATFATSSHSRVRKRCRCGPDNPLMQHRCVHTFA